MMNGTGDNFNPISSNRQRLGGSVNRRDNDGIEVLSSHHSSRSNFNGLAEDAGASIYSRQSKNYNPFYHPDSGSQGPAPSMGMRSKLSAAELMTKQKEERKKLADQRAQLMDEWGFQNEETAVAW